MMKTVRLASSSFRLLPRCLDGGREVHPDTYKVRVHKIRGREGGVYAEVLSYWPHREPYRSETPPSNLLRLFLLAHQKFLPTSVHQNTSNVFFSIIHHFLLRVAHNCDDHGKEALE